VIRSFRYKGSGKFFATGAKAGIQAAQAARLVLILAALNAATAASDMGLPGLRLHPLKGGRSGTWSVSVSGNWRITFRFEGKDATDVDYEDYH
jgi:proteic killer suppression protein